MLCYAPLLPWSDSSRASSQREGNAQRTQNGHGRQPLRILPNLDSSIHDREDLPLLGVVPRPLDRGVRLAAIRVERGYELDDVVRELAYPD